MGETDPTRPKLLARRKRAKDHVDQIRAATACERCGINSSSPHSVEWHNEEHVQQPGRRIGRLVANGLPLDVIDAEIARCEALCPRCHMIIDGRIEKTRLRLPGATNPNAKLTFKQIQEIRVDMRYQKVIAAEYGITQGHVSRIKRRAQRKES